MSRYQIIFISILVTISGCQPLTKPRPIVQGPAPDQAILRNVDSINKRYSRENTPSTASIANAYSIIL